MWTAYQEDFGLAPVSPEKKHEYHYAVQPSIQNILDFLAKELCLLFSLINFTSQNSDISFLTSQKKEVSET